MKLLSLVVAVLLFFVLTPGILLRLPNKGSKFVVAGVHALVFGVLLWALGNFVLNRKMEGFQEGAAAVLGKPTNAVSAKYSAYLDFINKFVEYVKNKEPTNTKDVNLKNTMEYEVSVIKNKVTQSKKNDIEEVKSIVVGDPSDNDIKCAKTNFNIYEYNATTDSSDARKDAAEKAGKDYIKAVTAAFNNNNKPTTPSSKK